MRWVNPFIIKANGQHLHLGCFLQCSYKALHHVSMLCYASVAVIVTHTAVICLLIELVDVESLIFLLGSGSLEGDDIVAVLSFLMFISLW